MSWRPLASALFCGRAEKETDAKCVRNFYVGFWLHIPEGGNRTMNSRIVLGQNQYGKAEVRVVKITRDTERHEIEDLNVTSQLRGDFAAAHLEGDNSHVVACLLYTSPSPRDLSTSRMPSSA